MTAARTITPGLGGGAVTIARDPRGVAIVTVGTGHSGNALDAAGWAKLADIADELAVDPSVAVVVIRGAGSMFCTGYDLKHWLGADPDEVDRSFVVMERACAAVERIPAPVVAAVRGAAAGAGCQLVLACDMRVLAADARIGMPVVRLGILLPQTFANRLVRVVGPTVAADLLYRGRLLDRTDACWAAIANEVVDTDDFDAAVDRFVGGFLGQPASGMRAVKATLRDVGGGDATAPSTANRSADPEWFPGAVRAVLGRISRAGEDGESSWQN